MFMTALGYEICVLGRKIFPSFALFNNPKDISYLGTAI